MRYLMIDRILEWEPGEKIKGIKNVAMSEDVLEFHFPRNPIMPGVLLLEALSQLTAWLEAASSEFERWFLPTRVQKCNFYGFVLPGDQVELEVRRVHGSVSGERVYAGVGTVGGKKNIKAAYEGELISMAEIEDKDEQRRFFELLTRGIKL